MSPKEQLFDYCFASYFGDIPKNIKVSKEEEGRDAVKERKT
jgi:hypothetical protein